MPEMDVGATEGEFTVTARLSSPAMTTFTKLDPFEYKDKSP
jgi:hypothetical protein